MKMTKANLTKYVRHQLATNKHWAVRALVRIFQENQTQDEQNSDSTTHDNGIGFTGTDAQFLSSLAKAQINYGRLTDKQMTFVFKKMPKYHAQVIKMSDQEQLIKLATAAQAAS